MEVVAIVSCSVHDSRIITTNRAIGRAALALAHSSLSTIKYYYGNLSPCESGTCLRPRRHALARPSRGPIARPDGWRAHGTSRLDRPSLRQPLVHRRRPVGPPRRCRGAHGSNVKAARRWLVATRSVKVAVLARAPGAPGRPLLARARCASAILRAACCPQRAPMQQAIRLLLAAAAASHHPGEPRLPRPNPKTVAARRTAARPGGRAALSPRHPSMVGSTKR